MFIILPILALGVDLLTPFLIWKNVLPSEIRWLSHLAIALMILLTFLQIISTGHVPRSLLLVLAVSSIGSWVAIENGQGIFPTLWGLWLLFQFPLICLFAYLQPSPPKQLATNIRKYALILLAVEVLSQLLQYTSGERPGDNLAGLFGRNGTGIAVVVAIMVNCLFLGYWLVSRRWAWLIVSMGLGLVSSALGEVKLYPVVLAFIGLMAVLVYAIKFRSLGRAMIASALVIGASVSFAYLYNSIVPGANKVTIQSYIENTIRLNRYLNFSRNYYANGSRASDFGRMYELRLGWDSIKLDPITLAFGYGIGARSESQTWGATGRALESGAFGFSAGKGLLILMQETGVVGLATFGSLILWIVFALARDIHTMPASSANSLRYALILFSILWPILLFYTNIWTMRVPMLSYWYLLGYVLAQSRALRSDTQERVLAFAAQRA